jgi:hypothetical protein
MSGRAPLVSRFKLPQMKLLPYRTSKPMLGLLRLAMGLACFGSLSVAAPDGLAPYDGRWALPSELHAALAA